MLFKFQNRDSLAANNEGLQVWTLRKETSIEKDSWWPAGLKFKSRAECPFLHGASTQSGLKEEACTEPAHLKDFR